MSTLLVSERGGSLHDAAGGLEVRVKGRRVQTVPTQHLRCVVLCGSVEISAAALALLMRAGVSVTWLKRSGEFVGRCEGAHSRASTRRRLQLASLTGAPGLGLARQLVLGKVANQRAVLLRRQRRLHDPRLDGPLDSMSRLQRQIPVAETIAQIRGYEGAGSAAYFKGARVALTHDDLGFTGRNHRPPRDPVNAALSFGYTLLLSHVIGAIWKAGLDPYIGVLHHAGRGAPELALDLIEEWRPLVDRVVFSLFNRRQLSPDDFRTPTADQVPDGQDPEVACYLSKLAARVVAAELQVALARPVKHPLRADRWPAAQLFLEQARQVVRLIEGQVDDYVPVSLEG